MAKADVEPKKADSIRGELEQLHNLISQRAYELFRNGEAGWGAIGDWLTAERELVWRPAVELREKENHFEVLAAVAGLKPGKLWRSIRFPDTIDPATAKAEYRNGLLRLTATIADRERKKVTVTAA